MVEDQIGVGIRVRHLDGAVESEVPLAVGEVEEEDVRRGHREVVVADQAGVARRPHDSIGSPDPEAAAVLVLEPAPLIAGLGVLPGVIGGQHGDADPVADGEVVSDVVAGPGDRLLRHHRRDVAGRVEGLRHGHQIAAAQDAEVVVVGVGDEHRIDARHVGDAERMSISSGMSKPCRTGSIRIVVPRALREESGHPQPPQGGASAALEGVLADRDAGRGDRLAGLSCRAHRST
ncbi:hypothetical protein Q0F99_11505 [Rathayibacter oskolensis]|nr:hypothetical protein [Rathayibacter oskolensis]WKK70491.1 hypothetical protein Q0F99_11505 [Rathayibacter oskolensis]